MSGLGMIERVARAEHDWDQADRKRLGGYYLETFDELSEVVKQMRFARARAAIEAMGEPTQAMVKAGNDDGYPGLPIIEGCEETYRRMIDAALKGG